MSQSRVNVAIVGCGGMAQHYLSVYRDLAWVRVLACVDINLDVAQRAAELVGAAAAGDEFEIALSPDIHAVIINTPNHLHRQQAVRAMNQGKHILLQKPIAANLPDAEAIAETAETSGVISGLYMSYF